MGETGGSDAWGKLVVRLTVGILTLFHGVAKILHPGTLDSIGSRLAGIGVPEALAYGVYVGEVIGPLLVIAGVYSRVGGLFIVINMLFAVGLMHTGDLLSLTDHGGWRLELQAFYLFGGLAVMLLGSGRLAFRPD
ncbi:MAG: DoxX family protein [Gammaproteobacteria bacterium]|jgi:putative oxidoreductase